MTSDLVIRERLEEGVKVIADVILYTPHDAHDLPLEPFLALKPADYVWVGGCLASDAQIRLEILNGVEKEYSLKLVCIDREQIDKSERIHYYLQAA